MTEMSSYGRDPWGEALEIQASPAPDFLIDEYQSNDMDRMAIIPLQKEDSHHWLLGSIEDEKKRRKKYVDLRCLIVSRKMIFWTLLVVLSCVLLAVSIALTVKFVPRSRPEPPQPDNYTLALHKALMFFNAQKCKALVLVIVCFSCFFC